MTNPIGNLFSAQTQQILEAPVGVHKDLEPNRIRRTRTRPSRKPATKKSSKKRRKTHLRSQQTSGGYYNHYGSRSGYQQLQLLPLGMDEDSVMHFYDPRSGNYYALQLVGGPSHQEDYYNSQEATDDDDYYGNDGDDDDDNYSSHYQHRDEQHDGTYDGYNDQEYNEEDQSLGPGFDYDDDVQVVDNWGYNDDDIFGERKLKDKPFNFKLFGGQTEDIEQLPSDDPQIAQSIVTIRKNLLKQETADDVKKLLKKNNHKPMERTLENPSEDADEDEIVEKRKKLKRRLKPKASSKRTPEDIETETVRNILGSFMKDDSTNRRRQSAVPKTTKPQRLVEQPRQRGLYIIYPHYYR